MTAFKINKNLNKSPLIWGLKLPLFGAFLGIVCIAAVTLISGLTIKKIFLALLFCVIAYLVCLGLSRFNITRILFSDAFPRSIKNNLNG